MALYFIILLFYAIKSSVSKDHSEGPPEMSLKDMWNSFGEIWGKKMSIYIIIGITLLYFVYSIYLTVSERKTDTLKSSRFWEENLLFSFAFSFGLFIPGYYLNKKVNYAFVLFIFLSNIALNVIWEMSGFYNSLYPYDPNNVTCPVRNNNIDLTECYDIYNNQKKKPAHQLYLYMFLFLLGSTLFFSIIPNIFNFKSSVPPNETFHLIDVLYLSLTNGILVLLAIQYTNVRRSNELLPAYESAIIIGKFVVFHIGLRFAGFM